MVALIAAGVVVWQFLWPRGGASSPQEAVEQLVLAGADQDPVAVLDMLSPAEVEGLDDVYDAARERAEEEGLVEDDGVTDALSVELSDLELDVDVLGDGIARVTVEDGRYEVTWDPEKLPERLAFLAEDGSRQSESGDLADLFDGEQPVLTTVELDGRWYVTILGTVAHYAYEDADRAAGLDGVDLAEPDYDAVADDVDPVVGEDPDEVVAHLVDAVNSGDLDQVLANLPEDLGRPLRPYVPVLEDVMEDEGWGDEIGLEVAADDLDLRTEELDGGRLKVVVEGGRFSARATDVHGEDSGSLTIDGDCVTAEENGTDQGTECLSESGVADELGVDEIFFVLSKADGGYQLDPAATAAEYAGVVVENLTGEMLDELVAELEDEV